MSLFKSSIHNTYGFITTLDDQNKVISYLHPLTPYRSLILCFGLGKGKTYTAACLSHIYRNMGYQTLYISSSLNSLSNFLEITKEVEMDLRSFALLEPYVMTFSKFFNKGCKQNEYGLIIIDEVHNLRENAGRYNKIKELLSTLLNTKLLIMSATPMVDSKNEFSSIIDLTGEKEPEVLFSEKDETAEVSINYVGTQVGNNILFLSKMEGKQLQSYKNSFKPGENPVYTETRQASMCYSDIYDSSISIKEQSSKIGKFLEVLDRNKKTVVFCYYITRGINFIAASLEEHGFQKWDEFSKFTAPCYGIIDGSTTQQEKNVLMNTFNNIANNNGSLINVLIGSSVLEESITLFRVRELHIMTPFWNSVHVEQSIGRVNRYNSHRGLKACDKNINVYLHAAYAEKPDEDHSHDIKMWNICNEKKAEIGEKLVELKLKENVVYDENISVPIANNRDVIRNNDIVWDFSGCFSRNKFKISWCKVDYSKCVGYDEKRKLILYGPFPTQAIINVPKDEGYTMWRSCVDDKIRITFNSKNVGIKNKKRGKIYSNMNEKEREQLASSLSLSSVDLIVKYFKDNNRYFDKQIEFLE